MTPWKGAREKWRVMWFVMHWEAQMSHLEIAGVHPSCQFVYSLIQSGFVLLHVRGPLWIVYVVNEVLTDLQPAGNVFLQNLLVKIVHVVMFLHGGPGAVWPATGAGRRQVTVAAVTRSQKGLNCISVNGLRVCVVWRTASSRLLINSQYGQWTSA